MNTYLRGEPPYTCPDIDRLIEHLGRQAVFRREIPPALQEALNDAWGEYAHTIESQLEEIRKANEGLREWSRKVLDEKDEEIKSLQAQVLELQNAEP